MPYIDFQQLVDIESDCQCDSANRISWKSIARSHPGLVRNINEDAFFHSTEQGIWAVADGMGGLARGDYASGVVAEAFVHFVRLNTLAACIRDLEIRLRDAHSQCRGSFPGEPVGSAVVALFNYGQYVFLLWAGDSRVYRLRDNQIKQLTQDHTVAQEQFARGELSTEQLALHPSKDILTRAVGVHQTLHLELDYETVKAGDRYLVCSDGLYKDLSLNELQMLLSETTAERALDALIAGALDKGGRDNITAIVVDAS
ncbi:MAG: protein phosphatase 2C domain-containing protein [Pseudomonadales bacterium]|nr:protein phosphatase 2C domain-containing protein [Pseudomonadales bacterium]